MSALSTVLSRQLNRNLDGSAIIWGLAALAYQLLVAAVLVRMGPVYAAMLVLPLMFVAFGDIAVYICLGGLLLAVATVPVTFEVPGINLQFNIAAFVAPVLGTMWFGLRLCTNGVSHILGGAGLGFAALIVVGGFSTVANSDRLELTHALAGLSIYAINALAFFMAFDAMKGGLDRATMRLRWFLGAAAAAGVATILWTVINYALSDGTLWKSNMISAGMGVGNLALFCTVGLLLSIAFAACGKSRRSRIVYGLIASGFVAALILSWSRAWFIGALVGAAVVLGVRSRTALAVYLLLIVCVAVFFPALTTTVKNLYSDRVIPETYNRFDIWSDGLRIGLENPIMGVGLSGYESHAGYDSHRFFASAHNVYIQVFAEVGILGLLALLAILALIFREACGLYRESDIPLIRSIALAIIGLIPAILVGGMFGHEVMASFSNGELSFVRGSFYLWFLAGCVSGIYRLYGGRQQRLEGMRQ